MTSKIKKILVVDDESAIREVVREYLTMMDFEVGLAENGHEALKRLHDNEFDLVITDLMMPKMSGIEMIHTIRKTMENQPVILLSGSDIDGMTVSNDAFTKLLKKPFSFDELMKTIQAFDS